MEIQGNTFLVSGGASGLGGATSTLLAASGANVVIADINKDKGEALAAELGATTRFVECNVADEDSVKAAVAAAASAFGRLNGTINCAGIGVAEKTVGKENVPHSLASFKRVIEVNLIGTFNVLRLAAAQMATQEPNAAGERGVVINTASIAAYDGQIGQAAYSASKGGIVGMTLPIARDLMKLGIRVVTIAPGLFDTPLLAGLPEDVKKVLGAQVPFPPRLGRPAEFAALAKHILENEMLNGEVIRLDGALRMPPK
ncbi:MAG TPA: SDR family NAD(P)-dependent oxidoreductase [Blastocatellia bacterium]|nr:SDR family NAD(P)-dependent oxidoreductase [Blastocatellia bacterium]HMY71049.1 SDR family NAD(P)-dependent oxidoreductase [Blastocatellia bacterium]HMZ18739.1 SDR family NAD(P)-dependent oxidoreductase [Blastocatellia bacterium]HNG29004.1 SDR family NAD(P)-dependent oxidoreductase [Blastocatellia bacterium]